MNNKNLFKQEYSVVITGSSSGIGAASVKLISKYASHVFALDIVEPNYKLENVTFFKTDISNFNEVNQTIQKISTISKIGYLFCNAGLIEFGTVEDTPIEKISRIINVNLIGTIYLLKAIIPYMKIQNFGKIVLMGSDQSFIGKKNMAIYGATKGAIAQLTKSTALEYAENNIMVNCVCPGTIETERYLEHINSIVLEKNIDISKLSQISKKSIPINRIGQPEEVAKLVKFLFSEDSSFMTGSIISIDGGYTAQ